METTTVNRMSLLEIDDVPSTEEKASLPAPVQPARKETAEFSQDGADRAQESAALADKVGLVFGDTLFKFGTIGHWGSAAEDSRKELQGRPLLSSIGARATILVATEARRSDVVTINSLVYDNNDTMRRKEHRPPGSGMAMNDQTLRQLMTAADAPGGGYLCDQRLPSELRALHVNHWLGLAAQRDLAEETSHLANKEEKPFKHHVVNLLSKKKGDARVFYGCVGEKYPWVYGMDRVINDVIGAFPGEVRGTLTYDTDTTRWRVDACLGTEFEPVVGDTHQIGVKFGAHDAGDGAYWANLYALRVRCINFSQLNATRKLGKVRHVGTPAALHRRVKALLSVGSDVITQFSELWKEANQTALIKRVDGEGGDAKQVFRALIKAGYVSAPDGREAAVENFFNSWLKEPGETRADYVNAITRAAHSSPWSNPWASDKLEEEAGKLLYNHVVLSSAQMEAVTQ